MTRDRAASPDGLSALRDGSVEAEPSLTLSASYGFALRSIRIQYGRLCVCPAMVTTMSPV
jgi:hypothetical protein